MPKISLIIPFYKAEKYIERLTQNIYEALGDIGPDIIEIIFVDDWGQDGSKKLLENTNLFEFKIVDCGRNQGLGGARNLGVENSSGEWIMFMDHDDLLSSNGLKLLVEKVSSESEKNFIRFNYIEKTQEKLNKFEYQDNLNYVDSLFPVMAWSKIIRRELYIEFEPHLKHEDNMWTLDFINAKMYKAIKYGVLNEYIYIYDRTNENSITTCVYPHDMRIVYTRLVEVLKYCEQDVKPRLTNYYLYSLKYSVLTLRDWECFKILIKYLPKLNFSSVREALRYHKGSSNEK